MRNFLKSLIAPILVAALVAGGANAAVWQWSQTAANNATADASINWSEGMSPSSVNDSARAMMARLADWRDDMSGALATTGTATAYAVTTHQGFNSTPTDGQLLAITPHATNGAALTLTADSGTAFAVQSSPGVAVASGTLVLGTPYTLKFSTTNSAWMLRNFYGSPFIVPLGAMLPYSGLTAPNSNFVLPIGQAISRTTYATYFAQVGTTYGAGDGVSTFNVPDMRQRTVYGGAMFGADAGRITATYFGGDPNAVGGTGGSDHSSVLQGNLPNLTWPDSLGISDTRTWAVSGLAGRGVVVDGTGGDFGGGAVGTSVSGVVGVTGGAISKTGTVTSGGSGTPIATVAPGLVMSFILRVQ